MSTIVEAHRPLVAQRSLYVLRHLDRMAAESALIVREMFPTNLRVFGRAISMYAASRARQTGGALATLGAYFLAMKAGGQSRAAADRALIWLESVIEWLWVSVSAVPTDDEIHKASIDEQEAEHRENIAQLLLHQGINAETLQRAIAALEEEQARTKALTLLLRRRLAAEK